MEAVGKNKHGTERNRYTGCPSWYAATQVAAPFRARLTFDLDVDVCVVGAGLAGLTVAREVARRGWSVAVLEATASPGTPPAAIPASCMPGFTSPIGDMIERVGLEHAKQLVGAVGAGRRLRARAPSRRPACRASDPVPGWLHVSKTDEGRAMQPHVEMLRRIRRRGRGLADGAGARGAAEPALFQRSALSDAPSTSIRSITRSALPPPRKRPARASSRIRRRLHRSGRRAQAHRDAGGAAARAAHRAGRQRPSRRADAAARRDAAAGHDLRDGDRAARPRLGEVIALHAARSATATAPTIITASSTAIGCNGRAACGNGRPSRAASARGACAPTSRRNFPAARQGRDRAPVGRHVRPRHAPHAADRRDRAGPVGGERLRRPRAQHHRDGRAADRARHRRQRRRPGGCLRPTNWSGPAAGSAARLAQGFYWGSRPLDALAQSLARYRERASIRKQRRLAARRAAAPAGPSGGDGVPE